MKEFEKWNTEHPVDGKHRNTPINHFKASIEEEREGAWRAALEWANRRLYLDEYAIENELGNK